VSVDVRVDPGRIARMLRLRGGIVERRLAAHTRRVADIARTLAPGSMPAYIDWRIEGGPRGLQGVVTCNHPATLYVLEGTRPHIIRPRRARALRFEADGRVVFANVVHHSGARPNDFLGRALRLGR